MQEASKIILSNQIEQACINRNIKFLFHFTSIENLRQILKAGIVPRLSLETEKKSIVLNDDLRLDGHTDASCVSITFPNYKMFYKLSRSSGYENWVVIGIDPCILWQKKCAFCYTNAASTEISSQSIQSLMGITAFNSMFYDNGGMRDQLGLELNETTNPQAEVLVFDTIEPSYFAGIGCYNKRIENNLKSTYGEDFGFVETDWLFSYRHDFAAWQ